MSEFKKKDSAGELVEMLHEGGMLSHPYIKVLSERAMATGDFDSLTRYLETYPIILAMAKRNINLNVYHEMENPFPYPDRFDACEYLSGPIKLGYINQFNDMFAIDPDVFCMPAMIPGRPGSGKSQALKYLLVQIFRKKRNFNVIIPDLKGNEYRNLLHASKNLKVITKNRLKLNPFQVPEDMSPSKFIPFVAECFVGENWLGATSLSFIISTLEHLYKVHGIFDGSLNYPTMKDFYNIVSKQLNGNNSFKFRDILLLVQNRLIPYVSDPAFNCRQGIPYDVWRKDNVVLEVADFTENVYSFIVSLIAGTRYEYNAKMGLTGSKLRTLFLVDEARVLFRPRDVMTFGESYITQLITRAREPGIGFIVSSQETESFNQTLKSASFTKICFPLTDGTDRNFIKESFGLTDDQSDYVFKLPKFGTAITRYAGYSNPFLLAVPHFKIKRDISTDELEQKMVGFYSQLESQIRQAERPVPLKVSEVVPPIASALLFFLGKEPFTKISEMTKAPGFNSPREINKALEWLIGEKFIRLEKYRTSQTKKSTYAVLQEKALHYLQIEGIPGKGGFEHSLYQDLIIGKLRAMGMTAKIEGRIKGSSKSIDVLGYSKSTGHIAYEVTLHFNNLLSNIHQDLHAGVKKAIIVTRDKKDLDKAIHVIGLNSALDRYLDLIDFKTIDEFFH
jgi:hypothetical protein